MNFDDVYYFVKQLLLKLGIAPHLKGYEYLSCAVALAVEKENLSVRNIYKSTADHCNTTQSCVERAVRNAVSAFSKKENVNYLNSLLGSRLFDAYSYPSSGAVICYLAEYVRFAIYNGNLCFR